MERRVAVLAMAAVVTIAACSNKGAPAPPASAEKPALVGPAGFVQGAPSPARAGAQSSSTRDGVERERNIVKSAELGIEASDPPGAAQKAGAIVEELGGYVASSERSLQGSEEEPTTMAVKMTLRVPSHRFAAALARLEELGSRTIGQQVLSDDVTEEVIDLRARIAAERALETQFLVILEQAKSVKDALEVHTQLADVRTSIEKLEGRKQVLENRVSMSIIKLAVTPRAPLMRAGRFAFGDTIARAGADLINVSAAIFHGAIRTLGVIAPILALVVAPVAFILRALLRRMRRAPAS